MPGEPHTFWDRVVEKAASALASGALQPIETRSVTLVDGGVRFLTRVAANLVRKQVAGKKRGPGFNPFLSPEEELLIGDISGTHYALLNKFNVIENHVLIVTRAFEEQESLLSQADFEALWISLRAIDGLAFYNAGKESGASQRHKHLQLVRAPLGEGPEHIPMDAALKRDPGALSFRHASCSLRDCVDLTLEDAATWELWSLPEMPWALLPRSGRWNGTNNVFSTAYWLPEGKFRRLRFCVLTPTPRSELVGLSSSPRNHSLCPAPMRVCSAVRSRCRKRSHRSNVRRAGM